MSEEKWTGLTPKEEKTLHCHKLVYATAVELAGKLYDTAMQNNEIYAHWKKSFSNEFEIFSSAPAQLRFVELMAPKLLNQARSTLAKMLAQPLDPALKAEIHEALVQDWQLKRGRTPKARKLFKM